MMIEGGAAIRLVGGSATASACLFRFSDSDEKALLLTVAHGVAARHADTAGMAPGRGNPIFAADLPGRPIGQLWSWTNFYVAGITADAALVWVDPALVGCGIVGLGLPTGVNLDPGIGTNVRICPGAGGSARGGRIVAMGQDATIDVHGPDWSIPGQIYRQQILCEPAFNEAGDSGSAVLDANDRLVGIVVALRPARYPDGRWVEQTVVTPIGAILSHPDFTGRTLRLLTAPGGALAPPVPGATTRRIAAPAAAMSSVPRPLPRGRTGRALPKRR